MTWNERCNFCDEDETLASFFNDIMRRISWYMVSHQEEWLYMYGELEKGSEPKIKSLDKLEDKFKEAILCEIGWAYGVMLNGFIQQLKERNDIELDEDTDWWIKDFNGELYWDDDLGAWIDVK